MPPIPPLRAVTLAPGQRPREPDVKPPGSRTEPVNLNPRATAPEIRLRRAESAIRRDGIRVKPWWPQPGHRVISGGLAPFRVCPRDDRPESEVIVVAAVVGDAQVAVAGLSGPGSRGDLCPGRDG